MENSGLAVPSWSYSKNEQHDPEQPFPSLGSFIRLKDQGQDRVSNLQGTAHSENGGFLLKKKNAYEFQDGNGKSLNPEWDPPGVGLCMT